MKLSIVCLCLFAVFTYTTAASVPVDPRCLVAALCSPEPDLTWSSADNGNNCLEHHNNCFLVNENCSRQNNGKPPLVEIPKESCKTIKEAGVLPEDHVELS